MVRLAVVHSVRIQSPQCKETTVGSVTGGRVQSWITSPLHVVAVHFDTNSWFVGYLKQEKYTLMFFLVKFIHSTMADPGFSGGDPWVWSKKPIIWKVFAKNCMKMKEIGPRGVPSAPWIRQCSNLQVQNNKLFYHNVGPRSRSFVSCLKVITPSRKIQRKSVKEIDLILWDKIMSSFYVCRITPWILLMSMRIQLALVRQKIQIISICTGSGQLKQ